MTIKELEDELGVQLVNRTTRNLSLTPAGELFLEYARASLLTLKEGIQAVRSQDGVVRGSLLIGVLQSLWPYVDLPGALSRFRSRYPEVEFAARSVDTGDVPGLVRSGYVDLSFNAVTSAESFPGVTTIPFAEDTLVAICSKSHSLADSEAISLDALCFEAFVDLSPERALRKLTDQVCLAHQLERNSVYQVTNVDSLLQFVAAGLGATAVELAPKSARDSSRLVIDAMSIFRRTCYTGHTASSGDFRTQRAQRSVEILISMAKAG